MIAAGAATGARFQREGIARVGVSLVPVLRMVSEI